MSRFIFGGECAEAEPAQREDPRLSVASENAFEEGGEWTPGQSNMTSGCHMRKIIVLFDLTDLVRHFAFHTHLTGIQRVQASIILTLARGGSSQNLAPVFLSFGATQRQWFILSSSFLSNLLREMFLPPEQRKSTFSAEDARDGILPYSTPFRAHEVLFEGAASVFCLLGTGWIHQDYFNRVLPLRREFGTKIAVMLHDLIPIFLPETCDSGTVRLFEGFLLRSLHCADHIFCVSESTARDLRRYVESRSLQMPSISVTRNGSSFTSFVAEGKQKQERIALPERFVLFVGTIEARKNHHFILRCWRRMMERGDNPPDLVCLGMIGWKCEEFLTELVETGYLGGKVHIKTGVSDAELQDLYERCLFTLCPSLYEGWGLPVGESLAHGKICVCSDRGAIPEVAGGFGSYIDIDDFDRSLNLIHDLIKDDGGRQIREESIRRDYLPIAWDDVVTRVVDGCAKITESGLPSRDAYPCVPYSTEIAFSLLQRDHGEIGGSLLLSQISRAYEGHFLPKALNTDGFLWAEEARAAGAWSEPQPWGVWLYGSHGELAVTLNPDANINFNVYLRLRGGEALADRALELSANGRVAWKGALGVEPMDILFRVQRPNPERQKSWRFTLGIASANVPDAPESTASSNNSVPTVGVERMIIVPESDHLTRTEILWRATGN
jgi:glycosyltransferase involved in cell wall biosynthesis